MVQTNTVHESPGGTVPRCMLCPSPSTPIAAKGARRSLLRIVTPTARCSPRLVLTAERACAALQPLEQLRRHLIAESAANGGIAQTTLDALLLSVFLIHFRVTPPAAAGEENGLVGDWGQWVASLPGLDMVDTPTCWTAEALEHIKGSPVHATVSVRRAWLGGLQ